MQQVKVCRRKSASPFAMHIVQNPCPAAAIHALMEMTEQRGGGGLIAADGVAVR
jgi:hypothetical protein